MGKKPPQVAPPPNEGESPDDSGKPRRARMPSTAVGTRRPAKSKGAAQAKSPKKKTDAGKSGKTPIKVASPKKRAKRAAGAQTGKSPKNATSPPRGTPSAATKTAKSAKNKKEISTWIPGRTVFSDVEDRLIQRMVGLRPGKQLTASRHPEAESAEDLRLEAPRSVLPRTFDFRDTGFVTAVKSQIQGGRSCNACVAFATVAVIESRLAAARNSNSPALDLSEAHLFKSGGGNCSLGWDVEPALVFCRDVGVADEAEFRYTLPIRDPSAPVSKVTKILGFDRIDDVDERKQRLAANGPLIGSLTAYEQLFRQYTGGVYSRPSGPVIGSHAVAVIGYDEDKKFWICKNSWGPDWGESGFFRLGYGECNINSFPFWDVTISAGPPGGHSDREILDAILNQARGNVPLRLCLRNFVCAGDPSLCLPGDMQIAMRAQEISGRSPAEGTRFCSELFSMG